MAKRILFATDVPFWNLSTGAEQRIFAIHRFLKNSGCECGIFYLGHLSVGEHTLIERHEMHIFASSSDQPPEKLANRIRWYADATIHQARKWISGGEINATDGPQSLTLEDFQWPWAVTRMGEVVEAFHPDAIIFEYIKLGYLLDGLSSEQRRAIRCLVDTHDVLHLRAEQFFAHGFPHWLKIDRPTEAASLQKFDAIMAIQENEARLFQTMTNSAVPVITAGHAVDGGFQSFPVGNDEQVPSKITVGYIGSKNFSNWQAIRKFLLFAWPTVMSKNKSACELLIAGAICEWFDRDLEPLISESNLSPSTQEHLLGRLSVSELENVRLLGAIESIQDFYDQIDVVINPVEFGTGLKIKNAESLRFGKLLITTLNGFDGMPEVTRLACMVVEDVYEMGMAINAICNELKTIRPMQHLAWELAQTEFSEQQAYSELKQYLQL